MRTSIASEIVNNAAEYPAESVSDAIAALQKSYRADPVQQVAEQQEWTFQ
jgi:hypothetical protein